MIGFYNRLYNKQFLPQVELPVGFLSMISQMKVDDLERFPSTEEISDTLRSCDPSKAASYDRFNFNFIKNGRILNRKFVALFQIFCLWQITY